VSLTPDERAWAARLGLTEATALRLKVHGHGRFDLPALATGNRILDAIVDLRLRGDRWRRARVVDDDQTEAEAATPSPTRTR